jgi:hypothetical protein
MSSRGQLAKDESLSLKDTLGEKASPAPPGSASSADSSNTAGTRTETGVAVQEKESSESRLLQRASGTVGRSGLAEQKQVPDNAGSLAPAEANKNLTAPTFRFELADKTKRDREEAAAKPGIGGGAAVMTAPAGPAAIGDGRGVVTVTTVNGQITNASALASSLRSTVPEQPSSGLGVVGFSGSGSTQQPMVATASAASSGPPARPSGPASPRNVSRGPATFGGAPAGSVEPMPPAGTAVVGADLAVATDGLQITQKSGTSVVPSATLALAAPTAPAPAPSRNYFYADKVANEPTNTVQRFARLDVMTKAKATASGKASAANAVLTSFEITRVGSEVRIVDGDGSVYIGYVQPPVDASRNRKTKAQDSAAMSESLRPPGATVEHSASVLADAAAQVSQDYFFRVVGTNRTFNENVTFSGQVIAATYLKKAVTATNSALPSGGAGRASFQEAKTEGSAPPPVSSRITGKLTVGKGNEVDVNAVSAGK